ncbi:MAG: hypothetical protein PHP23_00045 [Desulfobacterales bacterium]|nr:hypothetical protein [Desulfobacterales bacterium]MDD4071550.1 hypothetical protein [Desulfobacterales bacterium]
MVSGAFGGGPTIAYSVTLLKDSIDEFEGDFKQALQTREASAGNALSDASSYRNKHAPLWQSGPLISGFNSLTGPFRGMIMPGAAGSHLAG